LCFSNDTNKTEINILRKNKKIIVEGKTFIILIKNRRKFNFSLFTITFDERMSTALFEPEDDVISDDSLNFFFFYWSGVYNFLVST
jgi:hypothetical protein